MKDDLDRIMEVMSAAFDPHWGEAWTRRQVGDSLAFPNTHYRLVGPSGGPPQEEGLAAGFTLVKSAPGEEELLLIAVDPAYRNRGLGRQLLERAASDASERGAEKIFLEMRENNPAIELYRAFGFVPIGRRSNYYRLSDGSRIDAVTFSLDL
ncbi:GNAT family N-acetyltransferase [Tsuneonella mangrovi]|uniref:GNAT family N-acetyltransferase n=1 Tax=Tsuneonella mangrovi TaxID=1982042 RepID=UPI000BA2A9E0|nr:GNAT family N-acetyltransferase [Tsuneonella mangrovi]